MSMIRNAFTNSCSIENVMGHTRSFILQKLGEAFDKDKVL